MNCPNATCAKDMNKLPSGDHYCEACCLMVCHICHHTMERRVSKSGRLFHCDCMVFGLAPCLVEADMRLEAKKQTFLLRRSLKL